MSTGWSIGDWQVGQLTDAELRKGIARYQAALARLADDVPVRVDYRARSVRVEMPEQ